MRWLRGQLVELGGRQVGFRDREVEAQRLLQEVGEWGVCLVYGPLGAGKSTLLRLFAEGMSRLGDTAAVYINYDRSIHEALGVDLPELAGRLRQLADLAGQAVGVQVGSLVDLLRLFALDLLRWVRDDKARRILVIHDDVDRYLQAKGAGRNAVLGLVGLYANLFEGGPIREKPWGDKGVKALIAVSDQAAVELSMRYKGKGGLEPFLLWNLPREAFLDLARELGSPVDEEALWRLLGGNARALEYLALERGWDLEGWIAGAVSRLRRLPAARLRRWDGRPDGLLELRLDVPLLKANVLVDVSTTFRLSDLPREPWVDDWYAFQLPVHYWALKAMAEKGTVKVAAKDVLAAAGI